METQKLELKTTADDIKLTINDDPERILSFNPNDVGFVNRYLDLIKAVEDKEKEVNEQLLALRQDTGMDAYGIPNSLRAEAALSAQVCAYMREQVDMVFGAGTSQMVFGDRNVMDMFGEFFFGLAPYIAAARQKAVKKYTDVTKNGVLK